MIFQKNGVDFPECSGYHFFAVSIGGGSKVVISGGWLCVFLAVTVLFWLPVVLVAAGVVRRWEKRDRMLRKEIRRLEAELTTRDFELQEIKQFQALILKPEKK